MQNYRGNTNDYMRRGNCGGNCGMRQGQRTVTAPYTSYNDTPVCCDRDDPLEGMPLAMAYVPWQSWRCIYDVEKAFCRGTIFEELDKPFQGMGGCNQ